MRSSLAVKTLHRVNVHYLFDSGCDLHLFLSDLVQSLRDIHRPRCPANLSLTGRGQPPLGSKKATPSRSNLETVTKS